ncbi:ArnT family glycosyltransferase [Rhodanobacter ginsengisoli]|uniref:ArnT family glycosyltransferase n=1 Tax=Rhodanobacter ginsengisoli TaxID=418646 RepID=A0ABW0QQT4_9GAMM
MKFNDSTAGKRWRWPLALLAVSLLALALRWYYVSTALVLQPVRGDATQYVAYAWNLAQHAVFAKDAPGAAVIHPDNYRDPGYPLFLAIWMKWLGDGDAWYSAVLLCQAFLGALTVMLASQLGRYWLPSRWAFAAGVLMAVWPHSITITSYLLSETLFGFLCVLAALLCASAFRRESRLWAIFAGVVFGMASLTNAMLLPFGVLLAIFFAWRRLARPGVCIVLAIGCILLPGAWAIRNAQIAPPAAESSSLARALQNLEQGSWPDFQFAWRQSAVGTPAARIPAQVVLRQVDAEYQLLRSDPRLGAAALTGRFAQHPLRYARWYLIEKPYLLWGWNIEIGQGDIYVYPTANSPFQTRPAWIALAALCHALNLPLMLLGFASAFLAWPARRPFASLEKPYSRASFITVLALAAFVTAVYTSLQSEPRYSIPFRSFEILLAITPLWAVARWWQNNRRLSPRASRQPSQVNHADPPSSSSTPER